MGNATDRQQLTRLLHAWSAGDSPSAEAVLELVYDRVRQLAANKLRANPGNGLEPTELANELVINLLEAHVEWVDRVHFFRTVAVAMRNLLCDMGRKQLAAKHGGGQFRVTHFDEILRCDRRLVGLRAARARVGASPRGRDVLPVA